MGDWQHALRNRLNVAMYATAAVRDALAQGRQDDVLHGLARIETAIAECGGLLEHLDTAPASGAGSGRQPGQHDTGRAG